MKHRLATLVAGIIISIVGVGVMLGILVWVMKRLLDANGKVVDELAGALKRASGGGVGVELDDEGIPHYIDRDSLDVAMTKQLQHHGLTGFTDPPMDGRVGSYGQEVREAAARVQAIANQLAREETYLDHTDEFMPDEQDALFGPPPTIPPQEFIQDFSDPHPWPEVPTP